MCCATAALPSFGSIIHLSCRCRAATTLVENLEHPLRIALQWAAQHAPPQAAALPPQAAVMIAANADAMYYALLDHNLTCGWQTPPMAPPHAYLPTVVAAHPGECSLPPSSDGRSKVLQYKRKYRVAG